MLYFSKTNYKIAQTSLSLGFTLECSLSIHRAFGSVYFTWKGGDFMSLEYHQLELPFTKLNLKAPVEFLPYIPMRITVNEIVKRYLETHVDFRTEDILHKLTECGTGKLGYHLDICDNCGNVRVVANPCNHSLCTVCQERRSELWIESRIPELLPVPYFHIIFCLPSELLEFAMYNKKIVFDIMFIASASAMNEVPDRDGTEIGFISSLHTSTADFWFDPHMHICTPGIGILKSGKLNEYKTVEALRLSESQLRQKFRDVFLEKLQEKYREQAVKIDEENMEEVLNWPNELEYEDKEAETIKWPKKLEDLKGDEEKFNEWIGKLKGAYPAVGGRKSYPNTSS
jgi:hypothetical protein